MSRSSHVTTLSMRLLLTFVVVVGSPAVIHAQVSPIIAAGTVEALRQTLQDALKELQNVIKNASAEFQAVGNSLQANAQNVIADIDKVLGDKLKDTFDRLNSVEQRLFADAKALTNQVQTATKLILQQAGEEPEEPSLRPT
jgi:gas vesicle protein